MKKLVATLMALVMLFAVTALAEEAEKPSFTGGVQFGMDMDAVMAYVPMTNPEIEKELTRGPVAFMEVEYDNVDDSGAKYDLKYLFVDNALVAIHYDMADGTVYETIKAQLAERFGEIVPFDAAKIGNGKYAVDDDGDLKDCKEMIEGNGVTAVLEQDHDGDVDVTLLDPTAAYLTIQ